LSPVTLPHGTYGSSYSQTLTASGGAGGPYSFVVTAGALPNGVTLASGGALAGTATAAGAVSFTIKATGSGGFTGRQGYTLTVDQAPLTVTANNASRIYGVANPTFTAVIAASSTAIRRPSSAAIPA